MGAARAGSAAARGIAVQAPTNSATRTGRPIAAARRPVSRSGAEHLVAERRGLAELDRRDLVGAGAGQRRQHRADPAGVVALGLDRRVLVGPGAVVERDRPVLQHVGEVEEGRVAGRAVDAAGEPALRQPVEHPAGQVQRQRPLGPEQAEERDRDPRRRALAARA